MSGADAVALLKARLAGQDYPVDGVPDTPHNRDLWERIGRDVASMPPGVVPDIPAEWTEMPED